MELADWRHFVAEDQRTATTLFRRDGVVIVENFVVDCVESLRSHVDQAWEALVQEQLQPRGLSIEANLEKVEFKEFRVLPGRRIDSQYKIKQGPVVDFVNRLIMELPKLIYDDDIDVQLHPLTTGVIHAFPCGAVDSSSTLDWHRERSSLFPTDHIVALIPLVDAHVHNGTIEFIPGTHKDKVFNEVVDQLSATSPDSSHNPMAVQATIPAGHALFLDSRVLYRGLPNTSEDKLPVLYYTIARNCFRGYEGVRANKLLTEAPASSEASMYRQTVRNLYRIITGSAPSDLDTSFGHPHYTARFDLLLLQQLMSENGKEKAVGATNLTAVIGFCALPKGDRDVVCSEFVYSLIEAITEIKNLAKTENEINEYWEDVEKYTLFFRRLSSKVELGGSKLISQLGFAGNEMGLLTALALFKAHVGAEDASTEISVSRLEEVFGSWWNAGSGRFEFQSGSATSQEERQRRQLLVVFSGLGSGIARPEWRVALKRINEHANLDVLHVLDPGYSYYCQDPTGQWIGGDYYLQTLLEYTKEYDSVMYLGDSMGAAAALRFSSLADFVLAFSPNIDITNCKAMTRKDFPDRVKKDFKESLLAAVLESRASISVHFGRECLEALEQISNLPAKESIHLIGHAYDQETLSSNLWQDGQLVEIVESAIKSFLGCTTYDRDESASTLAFVEFLKDRGCLGTQNLAIGVSKNDGIRGIYTTSDMEAGERIMSIPFDCGLWVDENLDDAASDADRGLAFMECVKKREDLVPYFAMLPVKGSHQFDPTPDFFSDTDLDNIECAGVASRARRRKAEIQSVSIAESVDFEDLQFATWIVRSRSFETRERLSDTMTRKRTFLLPVIDMANHSSKPNVQVQMGSDSEKELFFAIAATRYIPAGKELTITYGAEKSPADLFMHYGIANSA